MGACKLATSRLCFLDFGRAPGGPLSAEAGGGELDQRLQYGVLDIEAPWTRQHAKEVRAALGENGIEVARQQILVDFVFLILYPLAISLACALIAQGLPGGVGAIGMMIAWCVLLAGPLDTIENMSMLRQLSGNTESAWPQISTVCASLKFTLIAGGLGFITLALLLRVVNYFRG